MEKDEIIESADRLYTTKLRTGLYDHYPQYALDILYEDCVRQAATMAAINNVRNPKRLGKTEVR